MQATRRIRQSRQATLGLAWLRISGSAVFSCGGEWEEVPEYQAKLPYGLERASHPQGIAAEAAPYG